MLQLSAQHSDKASLRGFTNQIFIMLHVWSVLCHDNCIVICFKEHSSHCSSSNHKERKSFHFTRVIELNIPSLRTLELNDWVSRLYTREQLWSDCSRILFLKCSALGLCSQRRPIWICSTLLPILKCMPRHIVKQSLWHLRVLKHWLFHYIGSIRKLGRSVWCSVSITVA